jgi:nucleotide-binding universal stress UspA family protein
MVLGSVSDRVVRAAERPVVVVPPHAAEQAAADRPLRRVLVPVDGSAASAMAASHLLELPARETLEAVLVHVAPSDGPDDEAQAALLRLARGLAESGLAISAHTVAGDDPSAVIVATARALDVDLIAMTTRGERGLARLAHGSTATAVLRSAPVPVLLRTPDPA